LVNGRYQVELYNVDTDAGGEIRAPTARGERGLTEIPFVIANARDMRFVPDSPPLIGVARASRNIYQLSADYRWQLFMSGQETLFVFNSGGAGDTNDDRKVDLVGAGVIVHLDGGDGVTPDARYVGPSGTGIAAHRTAIDDEKAAAVAAGARLFEAQASGAESGEALRLRYSAQTATLTTIAQTSASALERALRYAAVMIGADPKAVVVKPNLQFIDTRMTPVEAESLVRTWQQGAISYETLYENLQRGEIASPERSAEDELKLIDSEEDQRQPSPEESGIIVTQPGGDAAQNEEIGADGS
jgi:hypothetical protein